MTKDKRQSGVGARRRYARVVVGGGWVAKKDRGRKGKRQKRSKSINERQKGGGETKAPPQHKACMSPGRASQSVRSERERKTRGKRGAMRNISAAKAQFTLPLHPFAPKHTHTTRSLCLM